MRVLLLAIAAVLAASLAPAVALAQKPGAKASPKADRLEVAYKREYAFLEAEKRALQKRIAEEKISAASRIAAAKAEIASLAGQVVATSSSAENVAELMLSADRDMTGLDESGDVASDIAVRAALVYDKFGIELPATNADLRAEVLAQLRFIFETAPSALATVSSVRIEEGDYFDEDGKMVSGRILRIGGVGAMGLAKGGRGVLAPAGESRLKLWPSEDGAVAARALESGGALATLPIFLFESLDKGVEEKRAKSLREFIDTGGVIGWVIVFLGLVALAIALARLLLLLSATMGGRKILAPVLSHLERGERAKALAVASKSNSAAARVLAATVRNLSSERPVLEDAVAESVLAEGPRLARFGAAILVIAAVSPLLGLLGTVTGMISTFEIITEFGTGNPKLLSGGISEALITTELGLIVAIPALLVGHLLSGMAERARDNLDAAALAAINRGNGIIASGIVSGETESDVAPTATALATTA